MFPVLKAESKYMEYIYRQIDIYRGYRYMYRVDLIMTAYNVHRTTLYLYTYRLQIYF